MPDRKHPESVEFYVDFETLNDFLGNMKRYT